MFATPPAGLSETAIAATPPRMRSVGGDMNVLLVRDGSVERHETDDLPRLLKDQDAVIWVDIPVCDELAA